MSSVVMRPYKLGKHCDNRNAVDAVMKFRQLVYLVLGVRRSYCCGKNWTEKFGWMTPRRVEMRDDR